MSKALRQSTALSPLPPDSQALIEQARIPPRTTINDALMMLLLKEYDENPDFKRYLYANGPEDSIEGSVPADHQEAVRILRDRAKEEGVTIVADRTLHGLAFNLHVVMRRLRLTPGDRIVAIAEAD